MLYCHHITKQKTSIISLNNETTEILLDRRVFQVVCQYIKQKKQI